MTITLHEEVEQGSPEWWAVKCGILSASVMKCLVTPSTLKIADNATSRALIDEIAVQRVTKFVEDAYQSFDMARGHEDEIYARIEYDKNYAPVTRCGFITNDKWGFTLGFSPDGLVEPGGFIEAKSRKQKLHFADLCEMKMPDEHMIQVQAGMLIAERSWCDFISYSGGMPMMTLRIYPDDKIQAAILQAAAAFHDKLDARLRLYEQQISVKEARLLPTVRRIVEEMV